LDPQGHSSLGLGIQANNISRSIYDVLDETEEGRWGIRDVRIVLSDFLHLVPSEVVLAAVEQKLAGVSGRESRLLSKLQGLEKEYDFIILDCPPNLGLLTFNALRAAEELIIPVECSSYSVHGLAKILETVKLFEEALNHKLSVRALMNGFDLRTRFSKKIQVELTQLFPGQLFQTVIHHSIRLREAAACGKPISDYDRDSVVFKDFLNLVTEVIEGDPHSENKVSFNAFDIPSSLADPKNARSTAGEETSEERTYAILFTIKAPAARSVQVAGDFNHWISEELLPPIKEGGIWRKLHHLKKGTYRYKFLVDGEWMTDPQNSRFESNPFGGADSVLEVGVRGVVNGKRSEETPTQP